MLSTLCMLAGSCCRYARTFYASANYKAIKHADLDLLPLVHCSVNCICRLLPTPLFDLNIPPPPGFPEHFNLQICCFLIYML